MVTTRLVTFACGAVVASLLVGCAKSAPDFESTFSSLYREFNSKVLTEQGAPPSDEALDRGGWNTKTRRGSRQMRGVLAVDSSENPCAEILRRVDGFITSQTGGSPTLGAEGDMPKDVKPDQKHVYGKWLYNCQGRHGEIHIWLFPNQKDGGIAFAAHLYEEDLK